jgi:hypothetical protein
MNIIVRKVDHYREVKISCDGTTIDLGLLSEDEYRGLARQFMDAASKLLPYNEDVEAQLASTCDRLNSWAREQSVQECDNPYKDCNLRDLVDRLWYRINRKLFS